MNKPDYTTIYRQLLDAAYVPKPYEIHYVNRFSPNDKLSQPGN